MEKVLIDTDVVIDHLTERVPFDKYATKLFALCEKQRIEGYLTPVIIANSYYLLRQKNSREIVIGRLKGLLSTVEILEMGRKPIVDALNSDFNDFEDALQYFAAKDYGEIEIILTRNLKDYRKSEIPVMTPERYLKAKPSSFFE